MGKDVLSVLDLSENLGNIIAETIKSKTEKPETGKRAVKKPLAGKNVALLFEKPSLRTKVSFMVAVQQLNGNAIYMGPDEVQIGKRESPSDVGKVLSRYCDAIVYRAFSHSTVVELAEAADVPVINALDDLEHPCQAIGDLITISEKKGSLKEKKLVYIGDGNNVCHSLMLAGAMMGMHVVAASPSNYKPKQEMISKAEELAAKSGGKFELSTHPFKAVEGADIIYTDTWVSMGQEGERETREKLFLPYQVSDKMMAKAKADAIFMHCMPAHRGLEVTADVIDGPKSVVFDQAENRLHAQKALLAYSQS